MTYPDAQLSILAYCVEECREIDTCRAEGNECVEALAIQAIEKQIPKKVVMITTHTDENGGSGFTVCPTCGYTVINDYCGNCGQFLDWGF